jgi:hypothetical protein
MLQHSSFVNGGAGQSACGDVAQSGERLLFAGGIGSIPVVSTTVFSCRFSVVRAVRLWTDD